MNDGILLSRDYCARVEPSNDSIISEGVAAILKHCLDRAVAPLSRRSWSSIIAITRYNVRTFRVLSKIVSTWMDHDYGRKAQTENFSGVLSANGALPNSSGN